MNSQAVRSLKQNFNIMSIEKLA